MHLDVSAEVLLSQLGYAKSDSSYKQAQIVIDNTKDFGKFAKHVITLHDHLKPLNAYVGLSNKNNFLKIKCDSNDSEEVLNDFHKIVEHWGEKYHVALEKVENKHIYYITGAK